jgi:hypothetical protein
MTPGKQESYATRLLFVTRPVASELCAIQTPLSSLHQQSSSINITHCTNFPFDVLTAQYLRKPLKSVCNKIINDALLRAAKPQTHKVKHFHAHKNCTRREQSHSLQTPRCAALDCVHFALSLFLGRRIVSPLRSRKIHKAT